MSDPRIRLKSVTVEGQQLKRYDFVYLNSGREKPYVGMIMDLWQDPESGSKRMLVRWMFRPSELHTPVMDAGNNELFMALGSGQGAEDVNDLAVVQGKCNCKALLPPPGLSEPTREQLQGIDYYVSRCYNPFKDVVRYNLKETLRIIGALKGPEANLEKKHISPPKEKHVQFRDPNASDSKAKTTLPSPRNLFKAASWEDCIQEAYSKGKVLMLRGFDHRCSSGDLREALMSIFADVNMEVSIIPRNCVKSATSNTGEAVLAFKDRQQGNQVLEYINENCVILSEKEGPCMAYTLDRQVNRMFPGHIPIDKRQPNKDKFRDAVATSHCSQPNVIEYEMALQWRMLEMQHRRQEELIKKHYEHEVAGLVKSMKV